MAEQNEPAQSRQCLDGRGGWAAGLIAGTRATETDKDVLTSSAADLCKALTAEAELRQRAETRARRLEQIQRLGERLKVDLTEQEIGQQVVQAARETGNFCMAVLNLFDRPGEADARACVIATAGLPAEGIAALKAHDFPLAAVERLFHPAYRLSRSYFIPVEAGIVADTEVASWTPALRNTGENAWRAGDELLVPLTDPHGGHLLGFLSVDDPESGCRPDLEDVEALEIFADQAVVALRNARLLAQARYQAEHDPVTGLFNYRAASALLSIALGAAVTRDEALSLIMLDVDHFKLINDTYGHLVGDSALQHVAQLLRQCVRLEDPVARLGGDEYLLILPGLAAGQALDVMQRLVSLVQQTPLPIAGAGPVPLRLSLGVAVCPEDGTQPQALLAAADARLYEAKRAGRQTVQLGIRGAAREEPDAESFGMLSALVATIDNKDRYTREHSEHVAAYACTLADILGLSRESQRTLRIAGLLHDVGKIGVPDRILHKPGPLDPHEWEAIRQHVTLSITLLRAAGFEGDVVQAVAHHHERWDGKGYPAGLAGATIPLLGRIMSLADAAAAMAADRPYRTSQPLEAIITEIRALSGHQFDPGLVEPFINALLRVHANARSGAA